MNQVEVNGVKITLTKEQLDEIARQTSRTVDSLNTIEDAEKILKDSGHTRYLQHNFPNMKSWIQYQIETIIKAANFIDNGFKLWDYNKAFNNQNSAKYIAVYEKKKAGWVFLCSNYDYFDSSGWPSVYYIKEKTCDLIGKRIEHLSDQLAKCE